MDAARPRHRPRCGVPHLVDIIVVKYGLPELERECIESVVRVTEGVDAVVTVHDNYPLDENLSKVWNDLIRKSDAEYVCLLNNDTRIEEADWLTKLLECFDEPGRKVGAVGPLTNHASGMQGRKGPKEPTKKLHRIRNGTLVGFCMLFPKRVWEEAGGFDERFAIYGEDSDFCRTLGTLGYDLIVRLDVFVYHHGKSSTPVAEGRGKNIAALRQASSALYKEKWRGKK